MAATELIYPLTFGFKLNSLTSMLMHADDIEAGDVLDAWRKDPDNKDLSKPGDDRSPPWTWKTYLYQGEMQNGMELVMPQENIMAALRYAGSQIQLKGVKTFKKLSQAGLTITSEYCTLRVGLGPASAAPVINDQDLANQLGISVGQRHPGYGLRTISVNQLQGANGIPDMAKYSEQANAVQALGFKLYMKRARVNRAKHVRCRPRFDLWQVEGEIKVSNEAITPAIVEKMFEIAGDQSGLGDWRPSSPESPGPFGRFSTELQLLSQGDGTTVDV